MFDDSEQLGRYHRQMLLPGIGADGQRWLRERSALVVGCGALGTVISDALVRAGVGRLMIVDRDVVEWTNLQRQVLYDEADAEEGTPKAEAAAARLRRVNAQVEVVPVVADLTSRNVEKLCAGVQVVVDGTDNFQARYLLNDACVKRGLPLVYGGAVGTAGMTMTILPAAPDAERGGTPCLRCVFPEAPAPGIAATCDTAGVLGPIVSVIAAMQAAEALKVLTGNAAACVRTLREVDVWSGRMRAIDVSGLGPSKECPCCGQRRFEFLEGGRGDGTAALCGADAVQVAPSEGEERKLDLGGLASRLAAHGRFTATAHLVRGMFDRERDRATGRAIELTVFRDGRAIVKGTTDAATARGIYAKYVGA